MFHHPLDHCILCQATALELVVPLASMPVSTPTFAVPDALKNQDDTIVAAPLNLMLCLTCGHLQVGQRIDAEFNYSNYVYTTASSLGLTEHFAGLARDVLEQIAPTRDQVTPAPLVVEIGSNDGSLLRCFQAAGLRVLGIDPARRIAEEASRRGIETWPRFFGPAVAEEALAAHGPATVIVANNVLANVDDLDAVTRGVERLLSPDGVLVFETQYGADVIRRTLLDTVYHEHLSYFSVTPLVRHLARHRFEIIDVQRIATKGGSIRVTAQRAGGKRSTSPTVAAILAEEAAEGVFSPDFYRPFATRVAAIRQHLNDLVDEHHRQGRDVAGYGISVGTTALLHQFGLAEKIAFLVDDNPQKEPTLRGPGYAIPVLPPAALSERRPGAVIVFAWRYAEPIIAQHQNYLKNGGSFIIPLPTVTVQPVA